MQRLTLPSEGTQTSSVNRGEKLHDSAYLIEGAKFAMRDVELKLICELMKNSQRSDRELATVIRTSQPTVSRMIRKVKKERVTGVNDNT